ncbi:unnamed protein product [Musa acuminata subsp. malaccensis]|uniref:(wild Malaysian banana) hypothetical protein n=1 Tax=Musa acuminata subsp. malaccensis TaxID=214687 RepID=A0A804J2B4_MUSAM|nr:PREDICTED: kinesin-like protein KIN-12G [Musa acuminata subsp. malaccensis]CAG1837905.1 unnamed protein product [Musa acuminata subsp. malaccensis]
MPAVVEPGSVGSGVRFKEPTADSLAAEATGNCDRGGAPRGLPMQRFEPREDPSFWKDHNVQVVIRIRPLSSSEITLQGHSRCIRQDSCQKHYLDWTFRVSFHL